MHLTSSPRADHLGWCVPCFHGVAQTQASALQQSTFLRAIRRPVVKSLNFKAMCQLILARVCHYRAAT
eukprot:6037806-Amphidinium_carterae.1